MIRLLTRADDAGLCSSVNFAVMDAYTTGIIRNTSIMVNCAFFEEAAEMLNAYTPGLCIGLHTVINCEWAYPRWGSIAPADKVASMLLPDGTFRYLPNNQYDANVKVDEIMYEIQSQLDVARNAGVNISYIDQHCCFGWLYEYEVNREIEKLAQKEGLVNDSSAIKGLPNIDGEFDNDADKLIARLKSVEDGTYKLVTHLGKNNQDMQKIKFLNSDEGIIASERANETAVVTNKKVIEYCNDNDIQLIRYSDLTPLELGLAN